MRTRGLPVPLTARRGTAGAAATLLVTAALVAGGCGGDDESSGGSPIDTPAGDEAKRDPCERVGGERRKRFHVNDDGFRPRRVTIRSGTPVTFTNCGDGPHSVMKAGGPGDDFDSGTLEPGEEFRLTFAAIGKRRLTDAHNPDAEMTIEVGGLPGEPQHP